MKKFNSILLSLLSVSLIAGCSLNADVEPQTIEPDDFEEEYIEPADVEDVDVIDETSSEDDVYSAYIDFINNYDSYSWDKTYDADDYGWNAFQLIDLDGDDTLDLIATNTDPERFDASMQCYVFVTMRDGKLAISELSDGVASAGGYRGTKSYIPGEGIILDESTQAPWGTPGFSVFELFDDGIIRPVNGGYFEPNDDFDGDLENGKWFWDAGEVTKEKYDEIVKSYKDIGSVVVLSEIDFVDKDSILDTLSK